MNTRQWLERLTGDQKVAARVRFLGFKLELSIGNSLLLFLTFSRFLDEIGTSRYTVIVCMIVLCLCAFM